MLSSVDIPGMVKIGFDHFIIHHTLLYTDPGMLLVCLVSPLCMEHNWLNIIQSQQKATSNQRVFRDRLFSIEVKIQCFTILANPDFLLLMAISWNWCNLINAICAFAFGLMHILCIFLDKNDTWKHWGKIILHPLPKLLAKTQQPLGNIVSLCYCSSMSKSNHSQIVTFIVLPSLYLLVDKTSVML